MKEAQFDIHDLLDKALNIYHYGSYVYGTFIEGVSDYDFIVILPNEYQELDMQQCECENNQYNFYIESTWQQKLDKNEVNAMEVYFLSQKYIVKEERRFITEISPEKIRENFSKTASNSFVKCKKKLVVENSFNPKVGKKSLWHSLRIIDFGIQILTHGAIQNYSSANYLYSEIVNGESNDWEYYKSKYQTIYNAYKTRFRLCNQQIYGK